jgi:signal transduction histidine kinase
MAEESEYVLELLREGADFTLYRGTERGNQMPILALAVAAEQPSPRSLRQLQHEYSLATELDAAWAAQPLALTRHQGREVLILRDPGGEVLERIIKQQIGQPTDLTRFLRIAIGLAIALDHAHRQGLIHKDVKPANALVGEAGHVWLTGFGLASKLQRERHPPVPAEIIAGTLAYMAPEQTGRMNRSIDSRSDLYSLGVTLYQMLTGALPFAAADPLEWVHCHIARHPVAPVDRRAVPAPLSAIIMRLLAKNAEERYRTAAGKFDQYKRDAPYAPLAQAFKMLVRQVLVKSEAEADHWRHALLDALGSNGQLMVNLVPEIEFVIGKQPTVAELAPQEARGRFQLLLERFLGVFATAEHPLALFLDDLQWLDTATLELLVCLIADPDVRHVLLSGAYRDNDVSQSHPLMRMLAAIREAGALTQEIVLSPLGLPDVHRLVVEALRCGRKSLGPLAQLVHEKAGGNPFFAIQFLTELAEEGSLLFDGDAGSWICNLGRVRAKGYSASVVDLMVGKLRIRSQFARGAPNREIIDVNEINLGTVALLRDEAMRYNMSVRTELAADLPQVVGDRVQLQQVTMNLIVNSIEAMKDIDGVREILIKSRRADDEQILVSVSDTGIGFPPQQAEQIFAPFFTTKPDGTGMGLRISRSIIESHGGRLWAEGTTGCGATFHVNLPTAP